MPKQLGRKLRILQNTSGTAYVVVGSARSESLSLNNEPVDVTAKNSLSGSKVFRELLEQGGVQSVSVKMDAVYDTSTFAKQMQDRALANTHHTFRIEMPGGTADGGGYFQGIFMIASLERSGDYNNAATESYSLESAGEVTFTAATV